MPWPLATAARVAVLSAVVFGGSVCGDAGVQSPAGVQAPAGIKPGLRLPWPEVTTPIRDWEFARDVEEVSLETRDGAGYRSVTLWCAVLGKRLFIATGTKPKTWIRLLERNREARVGIDGRTYPVRAKPIRDTELWNQVVETYERKYPKRYQEYGFPRRGDLKSGRIYELVTRE